MEEKDVNTTAEAALDATAAGAEEADQQDAFMEGFDEGGDLETADQPEQDDAETETADATEAADQPQTAQVDAKAGGQAANDDVGADHADNGKDAMPNDQQGAIPPKEWSIKHMGETRTVTAEQITPELLQKAYDYDRVRGKYDEAKPVMEVFSDLARKAGMSVGDFVKSVRAETKKAQGMSEAEARRAVELEDREAAIAAAEAKERETAAARQQQAAHIRSDIAEFAMAFPDIYEKAKGNPKSQIPESVWRDVDKGLSLTAAYSRYAVANAAAQVKAANERADTAGKNAANAARSTGSLKSAGNDVKNTDPFLEGFGV